MYKMHYKPRRYAYTPGDASGWGDPTKEGYNKRRAIEYARWLAERDGIKIEGRDVQVRWTHFYSAYRKRKVRSYSGLHDMPCGEQRVSAVQWGAYEEVYNTRKDGRRGAFLYKEFVPETTIEIPNWDFEPMLTTNEDNVDNA